VEPVKGFYVYITLTANNIFVNCYRDLENGTREAVGFKQLSSNKGLVGQSKKNWESVTDMAENLAAWVSTWYNSSIIIVFKNFGTSYKRNGQTEHGIDKKRTAFIEAFSKANIAISTLVDTSAVPFNGCKTQKIRRKKKKHMIKHPRLY
jgi:ribosomal protein S11